MYHTYYFFRRLSRALGERLEGTRLMACWSGSRDVLTLEFLTGPGDMFTLQADLVQGRSLITFPPSRNRPRGPSADLFPAITGAVVKAVRQTPMDRSFHMDIENGLSLCFKMYGQRSNLLLHDGHTVLDVFNHNLRKDLENTVPAGTAPFVFWSSHPEELKKGNPTLSPRMWEAWHTALASGAEASERGFRAFLDQTETAPFYLHRDGNQVFLSFFPGPGVVETVSDPIGASNRLSRLRWAVTEFSAEKERMLRALDERIHECHTQTGQLGRQVVMAGEARNYRLQADLLMAYGHDLKPGTTQAVLPDFSGKGQVEIHLKKELSAAENAERLYRKARGQQQDLERISRRTEELLALERELIRSREALSRVTEWAGLKPFRVPEALPGGDEENLPYRREWFMGFEIRTGRNDRSNDALLRSAHKDDLWFHARDVAGSHVMVRVQKGRNIPQPVKERAASLAAYHSKARTEGLVPVMMTERKYVRKGKKLAPGQVRVERSQTLLAEPRP